jgi:hypothetical protein
MLLIPLVLLPIFIVIAAVSGYQMYRRQLSQGGVIRFAPGEVTLDNETGEFTRTDSNGKATLY